jgi:hypothetical protein
MSVTLARCAYVATARALSGSQDDHLEGWMVVPVERCPSCHQLGLGIEAASVALDLAEAEASIERLRRSVAWA